MCVWLLCFQREHPGNLGCTLRMLAFSWRPFSIIHKNGKYSFLLKPSILALCICKHSRDLGDVQNIIQRPRKNLPPNTLHASQVTEWDLEVIWYRENIQCLMVPTLHLKKYSINMYKIIYKIHICGNNVYASGLWVGVSHAASWLTFERWNRWQLPGCATDWSVDW